MKCLYLLRTDDAGASYSVKQFRNSMEHEVIPENQPINPFLGKFHLPHNNKILFPLIPSPHTRARVGFSRCRLQLFGDQNTLLLV